jgi:hypothetical protein
MVYRQSILEPTVHSQSELTRIVEERAQARDRLLLKTLPAVLGRCGAH